MSTGRLRRAGRAAAILACFLWMAACDPVMGTGSGSPPDLSRLIHVQPDLHEVVFTLEAGYPAGDYQFNYDGYGNGVLVVTVPLGWQATIQCENRGTVPNSCAVVAGKNDAAPLDPAWSTPNPTVGLDPGQSASFDFTPRNVGSYRIASLVDGHEASGAWADLELRAGGSPSLTAPGG
ncbi:MAG TPA: sulfocyanin-like copper-binding protein [Candidatus Dormibacteraeota bacterium]|nr:sulfocyanin-like copper-binding protein [Candidatus Dormibacteraeota bacterium]